MILKQSLLPIIIVLFLFINKLQTHLQIQNKVLQNCSYEITTNITGYPKIPNGSYKFNDSALIPTDLVYPYDYELLYDGTNRSVPQHARACFCKLKSCITLCSDNILQIYSEVVESNITDDLSIFAINMTNDNGTEITKNIIKDFAHIVLKDYCEHMYFVSPQIDEFDSWSLFENGSLLLHRDQVYLTKNEYCFEVQEIFNDGQPEYLINPSLCAEPRSQLSPIDLINNWTQIFSIPFFLLTIFIYGCLPELRNLQGKCFMSYLSSLTLSYSLLSYINLSDNTFDPVPCIIMGYLNHYMQLSHYIWLGIISFNIWQSFNDITYKTTYWKYAPFGWGIPMLLTLLTFAAQNLNIADVFKPEITVEHCGLEVNKWSATIYLYGPCLIILAFCLVAFILTSKIIKANDMEVLGFTDSRYESKKRYSLYLRLFLMMGLSWFLDVLSYVLIMFKLKLLSAIIDFINAVQGLYIFINFIGRRRVRNIIRKKLSYNKRSFTPEHNAYME